MQKLLDQNDRRKPKQRVALKNEMWSVKPLSDGQVQKGTPLSVCACACACAAYITVFASLCLCTTICILCARHIKNSILFTFYVSTTQLVWSGWVLWPWMQDPSPIMIWNLVMCAVLWFGFYSSFLRAAEGFNLVVLSVCRVCYGPCFSMLNITQKGLLENSFVSGLIFNHADKFTFFRWKNLFV